MLLHVFLHLKAGPLFKYSRMNTLRVLEQLLISLQSISLQIITSSL